MSAAKPLSSSGGLGTSVGGVGGIFRVVLTGGPCGGKSTALQKLSSFLHSYGFDVYLVPEVATLLLSGGATFAGLNSQELIAFQTSIISSMIALEDNFMRIAESRRRPAVIVCDRGTMDASAYMDPELWQLLLDENNWTNAQLRDRRYDAVIHMVTAAFGAEEFYTTENNTSRRENVNEAREVDMKLRNAWMGHPHLFIVDNAKKFDDKVHSVLTALCCTVGLPSPGSTLRQFTLPSSPSIPDPFEEFVVEMYFLAGSSETMYIQTRHQHNVSSYSECRKRKCTKADGTVEEVMLERRLTTKEYATLRTQIDPDRLPLKKIVKQCLYNQQYLSIVELVKPIPNKFYVEVRLPVLSQGTEKGPTNPVFPLWLPASTEITNDPSIDPCVLSKRP
ncbi:AAA family ATPase [Pelomyxa schiedti]|nr:AAA family ATPase [Pelomyxa schiedti]